MDPEPPGPRPGAIGYFVSVTSGNVMDVAGWSLNSNGTAVIAWHRKDADTANQHWAVQAATEHLVELCPQSAPAKALDRLRLPARYRLPDRTVQWDRHGRTTQRWCFLQTTDDEFRIVDATGQSCVSYVGHGEQLQVVPVALVDRNQLWRFVASPPR
jgi:hypothetical protein